MLVSPSNQTTITSFPVPSTADALAGVGPQWIFEVDVMLPAEMGSLKLSVTCPSRALRRELVGAFDAPSDRGTPAMRSAQRPPARYVLPPALKSMICFLRPSPQIAIRGFAPPRFFWPASSSLRSDGR